MVLTAAITVTVTKAQAVDYSTCESFGDMYKAAATMRDAGVAPENAIKATIRMEQEAEHLDAVDLGHYKKMIRDIVDVVYSDPNTTPTAFKLRVETNCAAEGQ